MSIRAQLLLVISTCTLAGLALAIWIGSILIDRVTMHGEHGSVRLAVKDGERLEESGTQFLLTADLIAASGETYLLSSCLDQLTLMKSILQEIQSANIEANSRATAESVGRTLTRMGHRLKRFGDAALPETNRWLTSHDEDAEDLLKSISALSQQLHAKIENGQQRLDHEDSVVVAMVVVGVSSFALLMLLILRKATKSIVRPLQRLRDAAREHEIEQDHRDQNTGPSEVRSLWRAVLDFSNRQRETREELEEADRVKDRFVANMSHELRTPLNGILGSIDLLLLDEQDAERRAMLEAASTSSHHLLGVIGDILDYSKIQSGRLTLDQTAFEPTQLIFEIAQMLGHAVADTGIQLEVVLDPVDRTWPVVIGDPLRLRQVLLNLVGNAIKFTPVGRVLLTACLEPHQPDAERTWIRFDVVDSGVGIPAQALDTLFEPFVQADASTTRKHGGTGLGLSISRQLIEQMGGDLTMQSEVGRGTEASFTLAFPKAPSGTKPESLSALPKQSIELYAGAVSRSKSPLAAPQPSPAQALPTSNSRRVLLVEDNVINQRITEKVLTRFGYTVEIAEDGSQGLERSRTGDYDVILMDMQMPVLDGLAATAAIREEESQHLGRHRVPIIALTANAAESDRQKCLDAGADAFLTKPVQIAALMSALEEHVKPT